MNRRTITSWRDLSPRWRKVYLIMAARYRDSRTYATNQAADHAAFLDVRNHYWQQCRKAVRQEHGGRA